ncbi:MAG: cupin domain-containing protein, partial [Pararhodobacter sp.]|nr:cupin domain-containing protein [Pararhodobacter sp.]
ARDGHALVAPNGTRIEIEPLYPPLVVPETAHEFAVRRLADGAPWVIGRAGMQYRDLVPSRLGGSMIASHIRIPDGGPVPDMVHYHTVGFQLIFCYRGWVDLVYEDQGDPFRLHAGNCVIQPPEIRHRVLHASDNIEVIEIGVPAEHVTTIDHAMTLPNGPANPGRRFQGQRFVHHRAEEATWAPFRVPGFASRDTTIGMNTQGVAGVHVVKRANGAVPATRHHGDILFTFVMEGTMRLEAEGAVPVDLAPGDAFVIPPGLRTRYADTSTDIELLEVSLPAVFETEVPAG